MEQCAVDRFCELILDHLIVATELGCYPLKGSDGTSDEGFGWIVKGSAG